MQKTEELLLKVSSLFWLIAKIWSYKAWGADRLYPVVPYFDFLEDVPHRVHLSLFYLSLFGLLWLIVRKPNRILIGILLLVEISSCLLDTLRWQPWEYMYICILGVYFASFKDKRNIRFLLHLLFVAMYIFTGIHKLNRNFLDLIWVKMILTNFFGISLAGIVKYKLYFLGFLLPLSEMIVGIMLLFAKNKRRISFFLMGIHITILFIIGPLGLNINSIIWFWNLAIICMLLLLYKEPIRIDFKWFILKNWFWMVLWMGMPILSFSGYWFQYFSFNLYSGKGNYMYLCFDTTETKMQDFSLDVTNKFCEDKLLVDLSNWSLKETNLVPIPDESVRMKVADKIQKTYPEVKIYHYHYTTKQKIEHQKTSDF